MVINVISMMMMMIIIIIIIIIIITIITIIFGGESVRETLAFWSLKNIQFYLWENWWFYYRLDRQGFSNCALDSFWRYRLFGKNTTGCEM